MKLSKMKLRKLMENEAYSIEQQSILREQKDTEMVAESLGTALSKIPQYAKKGTQALQSAGAFIKGVRKFLKDNQDWIDPMWEMLKDIKAERGDADVSSGGIDIDSIDVSSSDDIDGLSLDVDDFSAADIGSGDSDSDSGGFSSYAADYDVDAIIAEANKLYIRHSKRSK
jgi:hypothetical protein